MKIRYYFFLVLLMVGINSPAYALSNKQWANISDVGAYSLLGTSLLWPVIDSDWRGLRDAGLSLGTSTAITQFGKAVIHKQRPDNSDDKSFPSGHSSMAFAAATTLYLRNGWEFGVPAYAIATLTAGARVGAKKHFWIDVIAGAAVGTGSAWLFTDPKNDKVRLLPWVEHKGGGVALAMRW